MKYMLLIYDNPDTRERFFGDEGDALMGEIDVLMAEGVITSPSSPCFSTTVPSNGA